MKRFRLLLLLTVLMSMIGIQVNAHDFAVDGFYYKYIDNQTAVAVTYRGDGNDEYSGNVYSGSLTIPSTVRYNGTTYPVKMIDDDAFAYCHNLTSITIRNSVTSIGSWAFYNCSGLTTITIPTSVTSIGDGAFYNTPWFNNKSDGVIYINNLLYTYKGTVIPQSITVKTGTTSICGGAFSGRSGLKSIVIPNSLTTIGDGAFSGCTGLTSFDANSLTSIGNMAFYGCTGLTSFTANSLTTIGDEAFQDCMYFERFTIPNTVTSIGSWAFNNSGLSSVTIPNSVTSIGHCAFATGGLISISVELGNTIYDSRDNCNAIINTATNTMIAGCINTVIPSTVTSIDGAFCECAGLRTIEIPNSITIIGAHAFYHSSVGPIDIPNSVMRIGSYAFKKCGGLASITIPASVSQIDGWAFDECTFLTSVTVERGQPAYLGTSAFYYDSNRPATLYVPSGCANAYSKSSWNRYFQNIEEIQTQKDLSSSDITIDPIGAVIFNGSNQYPDVIVKDGNTILTNGIDYTVSYMNNINAGTAMVTITGMGNYTGSKNATFTINPKNASNLTINSISAVTYNGSAQTPTVTVKDGSTTLTNGTDYTVAYSNNTNAGTATVTITGKGNYTSTKTATFTINPRSASNLTISSISAVTYNGSAQTPTFTVKDGSTTLTIGADYTVSYSNNTSAGTATVTITGKGNYTGTKNANFTINPKNASNLTISSISAVTYTGSAQTPTVTVKDGSTTLTNGTDYTVAYNNNTNAGTATVTITGKGNYTSTKTATFSINPKNASNLTISSISAVTYTGSAQTPTVTVKDGSTTLISGTDYTVAYSNNINAGTATVTVTGKGNYTGTKMATFTINAKNASNLTISSIAAQTYTGLALTPAVTIMNGAMTLTNGTDYTVSYSNNTNAGTATMTITGMGNYTSTKTANFTIEKASLTITANDYSINQKDEFPAFEATYNGFVNGETESVMMTLPSFTCSATDTETPGSYTITPSGATAQNYDISYVSGTLTINAVENVSITMATNSGSAREAIGYSSEYGLDFTDVSDVKAYVATGFTDDGDVLLSRIYIVPANTGIYLKSVAGAGITVTVPTTDRYVLYANLLKPYIGTGTLATSETIDGVTYNNYVVGTKDGKPSFAIWGGGTFGPHKAYMPIPESLVPAAARAGGFSVKYIDEEPTAIEETIECSAPVSDTLYDLQGRKVSNAKRGIYVRNGKKVFIK